MKYQSQPLNHPGYQNLLSTHIGFGKAQKIISRPLFLLFFSEGAQSIILGIVIPSLSHQWDITTNSKSLLVTMVYLGIFFGAFIPTLADKYGRHKLIILDGILQTIFGLISCLCNSIQTFTICRFFYGISIGIISPLSDAYLAQITPALNRAQILTKARIYWAVGSLMCCLLSWLLLQNHHWRYLLLILTLPGTFGAYLQWKEGKESLRYLWVGKQSPLSQNQVKLDKQYQKVTDLINYMADLNGRSNVSESEIKYLMNQEDKQIVKQESFMYIFGDKYLKMTINLSIGFICGFFIYNAILILLPLILNRNSSLSMHAKFLFISATTIFQILSLYSSIIIMNSALFGRKRTIFLSYAIVALSFLLIIINGQQNYQIMFIMIIFIKFFSSVALMTMNPYCAEIYETSIRGRGVAFTVTMGRSATVFLGVAGINALEWCNGNGIYYIAFTISLIGSFMIYQMPYCTRGRPLDT